MKTNVVIDISSPMPYKHESFLQVIVITLGVRSQVCPQYPK